MKARIQIVDNQDNLIGYKQRDQVLPEDIYRVSGLWILNEKDEILLARRSRNKKHDPGKWGTSVAGTLDEGETYESNIVKEAKEELGLEITDFHKGELSFVQREHRFFCQWFWIVLPSATSFTLQEEEVEEVQWFSREELVASLQDTPDQFLKRLPEYLKTIPATI